MKFILTLIVTGVLGGAMMTSCKKQDVPTFGTSSLTVVNVIPTADTIIPQFYTHKSDAYYNQAQTILTANYKEFGGYTGAVPLQVFKLSDTLHALFNDTLHLQSNTAYSLFVGGATTKAEYLFTQDTIPVHATSDSVTCLRFVHMSSGTPAISINIKGSQATPLVASMNYLSATGFITLPAQKLNPSTGSYALEIRDAVAGTLLTSYTFSSVTTRLSRSYSLILKGVAGGTGKALRGTLLVNNY